MKISRSPVSSPKPSPARVATAPRKLEAPGAGRAGDSFEAPRVNVGVGGLKGLDFDTFAVRTQPSRTVTTDLPTGSTPEQTAGQNARLGSTLGAEVTPDGFSREARLRDLLKFDRTPITHDPGMQKQTDLLTNTSAPQESDGKNSTTSRGNASEGFPTSTPSSPSRRARAPATRPSRSPPSPSRAPGRSAARGPSSRASSSRPSRRRRRTTSPTVRVARPTPRTTSVTCGPVARLPEWRLQARVDRRAHRPPGSPGVAPG